jgi:hypothetical protein
MKPILRFDKPSINQGFTIVFLVFFWWVSSTYSIFSSIATSAVFVDVFFAFLLVFYIFIQCVYPGYSLSIPVGDTQLVRQYLLSNYKKVQIKEEKGTFVLPFTMDNGANINLRIMILSGKLKVYFEPNSYHDLVYIQDYMYWGSLKTFCRSLQQGLHESSHLEELGVHKTK